MILVTTVCWLCLITHVVYSTFITVSNNGDDSVECCKEGNCACSSLPCALKNMKNNTVINITSKVVTLNGIVEMGSGNLNNIAIIGNGTIMCNNTGGVYCESCSDITIMGITWYQCGRNDSMHPATPTPALNFIAVSNMIIHKCIFLNSSGCPVYISYARESITITDSYFMDNTFNSSPFMYSCAGLFISSEKNDLNVSISSSGFYSNGCGLSNESCYHCSAIIIL